MAKSRATVEVLVLGTHPCASLAASLLHDAGVRVAMVAVPHVRAVDRLVQINPAFFQLNSITTQLKKQLNLTPCHGLVFLGVGAATRGVYRQEEPAAYVTSYAAVHEAMLECVQKRKITSYAPATLHVGNVDDKGVEILLDDQTLHPRLVLVADPLPEPARRALGVPVSWDMDILQNYAFLRTKSAKLKEEKKPVIPITLELEEAEYWGWAHQHGDELQISVTTSPAATVASMKKSLQQWIEILRKHQVIDENAIDVAKMQHVALPLGGALSQEDVGNRTMLFGPAGGFYSATGEDIYPNCWSAIFAAELAAKALKEKHLQDGLQAFRNKWGSTLGDYLRGPQQNLKFLLPLVYRNPVMCTRLAESILTGASVVR